MAVSILVCGCGLKVRAAGATPGRTRRCPRCGGELRVPDALPPEQPARREKEDDASPSMSYGLKTAAGRPRAKKRGSGSRRISLLGALAISRDETICLWRAGSCGPCERPKLHGLQASSIRCEAPTAWP